jgi:hypothetical protein
MPPWRLVALTRQTSHEVECQLQADIEALETWLETNGLPVKKNILDKVRKQLAGGSALVDFWGQTVWHALAHMALPPRWQPWVDADVLARATVTHALSTSKGPDRTGAPGDARRV